MGYETEHVGRIRIEPPLEHWEYRDKPFLLEHRDAILRVERNVRLVPQGELIEQSAGEISCYSSGMVKAYRLEEHIQEIVDAFPGRTYSGYIECRGECGDLARVYVKDGRVCRAEPTVEWPEEAR